MKEPEQQHTTVKPDQKIIYTIARAIDAFHGGPQEYLAAKMVAALTEAGYAIVPLEPTQKMVQAGVGTGWKDFAKPGDNEGYGGMYHRMLCRFRAMVRAFQEE